jgi:hypothetical protein
VLNSHNRIGSFEEIKKLTILSTLTQLILTGNDRLYEDFENQPDDTLHEGIHTYTDTHTCTYTLIPSYVLYT